jgi:hypothetical protein
MRDVCIHAVRHIPLLASTHPLTDGDEAADTDGEGGADESVESESGIDMILFREVIREGRRVIRRICTATRKSPLL